LNKKPSYIDKKYNFNTGIRSSIIDELPLWSAPFGLELLDQIEYRKSIKVLDIGFGSGFPLIEIAQRLGRTSTVYGIDPWEPSHIRINQKIKFYGLKNVKLIKGAAENIPLKNNSIDLIVSNNGINNVSDIEKVFKECERISKKGSQFVASINLNRTFEEFYDAFKDSLRKFNMLKELENVYKHIYEKRKPTATFQRYFLNNGFKVTNSVRKVFTIKYSDEDAFFNHSLIKIGFMSSWEHIINKKDRKRVFDDVIKSLQKITKESGHLEMTVPYLIVNSVKL